MEKGVKGTGRRVALALAGGGARGVAHIGAIEELERRGYEIAAVAGTSMGALVGGMYAAGHLEEFKEWMCSLDRYKVFGLVDFTFSAEGLVKGSRVIDAMKELIPDMRIEQMRLPFTAVSADLLTGREVVIERGGLYDAIRASIAIPSVFRPVHRDGMVLTDGGIVNPMPVNRVRREAGDLLVAVDVCAPFAVEGSGAVGGECPGGRRERHRRRACGAAQAAVAQLLQAHHRVDRNHDAASHAADVPSVPARCARRAAGRPVRPLRILPFARNRRGGSRGGQNGAGEHPHHDAGKRKADGDGPVFSV